jgi:surface protein
MINNFNFPEGVKWSLNYISGPDFFSDDFEFSDGIKLFYGNKTRGAVEPINISKAISVSDMFYGCENLVTIPQLDTSNVTNMSNMFYGCSRLITIPQLDTSNVTSVSYMFYNCGWLLFIPQLDTSNMGNMNSMFVSCTRLRSIPLLDCSKVTSMSTMFGWTSITTLTDLGGFKNLKISCTSNLNLLPNLTIQSLMNVINNLYDFRANGESTTRTLQLGTTNLNKLTDEQKAVATNKGWNLT